MTILLVGLHLLVCLFLIFVVLLQSAQAADLAGAFGGGGSQTALGMRGATTILHKATTGAAALFMITSLALGMTGRSESSLIQGLDDTNAPAVMTPDEEAAGDDSESRDQDEIQGAGEAEEDEGSGAADRAAQQQGGGEAATDSDGSGSGERP